MMFTGAGVRRIIPRPSRTGVYVADPWRRVMDGFSPAVRRTILTRDDDRCVRCARREPGLHLHHRQLRSQGGEHVVENGVTLCARCHRWTHGHVKQSVARGLIVPSWDVPVDRPVLTWRGEVLLLSDGTLHRVESLPEHPQDDGGREDRPKSPDYTWGRF